MTDDSNQPQPRSWLERLSQALLREPQDREQLVELLRDASQRELLDESALNMIEGVLQISEMQVRDIMVPRAQMVIVEQDAKPEEFLPVVVESAHSRFPVIGENRDEVIGILLAKDLLNYDLQTDTTFEIAKLLRPFIVVPESKRLDALLQEFRRTRNHIAIVIDEYGNVAGLVTLEDILEQIVGDIEDEYDIDEETNIKQYSKTQYIVKALTPVEDFNEYFKSNLNEEEYDTIGGLVTHEFGHLPKRGESILLDRFRFKILHADNRRIRLMRVTTRQKPSET